MKHAPCRNFLSWSVAMLCLAAAPVVQGSVIVVQDAVEGFGASGGWTQINGGFFPNTIPFNGLDAEAGTTFFAASGTNDPRGLYKQFAPLFQAGTYTVTYKIGDRDDMDWVGDTTGAFLFAGDGSNWGDRILPTSTSRTVPVDGWVTWTDTYQITAASTNEDGDAVVGQPIGFRFLRSPGSSGNINFDDLTIQFMPVPEPASFGLVALGAVVVCRPQRRE